MVQRHEGVYDGRYKLIHFYDLDEWELIDTEEDPMELKNVYFDADYRDVVARMDAALRDMKMLYAVPAGIPAPREVQNPAHYFSKERRLRESLAPMPRQ
jgi:hypothetical protein